MRHDKSNASYLQCFGDDFFVYMWSVEQLEISATQCDATSLATLHLDATGSVVRNNPYCKKKNVLLCRGNSYYG